MVANPPFGNLDAPIKYDGYNIVKLDHLIAVKALSVMKDNGRGAIIIGASFKAASMLSALGLELEI